MDLSSVLHTRTDDLGHPTLQRYYSGIFASYLPSARYDGAFRVRAALNFGVQQLATRSRMNRAGERYLQIGGNAADDLAAALIHAMPHTDVNWRPGRCGPDEDAVREAVAALRAQLPPDGMPENIRFADDAFPDGCFGLIAVFGHADLAALGPLLNPQGRILHVEGAAIAEVPIARIALGRCGVEPTVPHRPSAIRAMD
jgi:hypothetical protein